MCGIAGVVSRGRPARDPETALSRMLSQLGHRGPDGSGRYRDPDVTMGATRLAIIDLAGSNQPLYSEDRSVALIVNGEIYNYVELRQGLLDSGHSFVSAGDSEVIVHLYEEHGLDFVDHLRGMFALALWDRRRRRLVLARDRMGEKPLYLHQGADGLYFASELKALLAIGRIPFELEPSSVHSYFHFGYVPEPATMLRGVRKLPAASLLVVDVADGTQVERRYWRMDASPPIEGDPTPVIRQSLEEVSGLVVRSDVPVGIALSGGLDSSALALLAARVRPDTLQAFTVGYPDAGEVDERPYAAELCRENGIPFQPVEVATAEMVDRFSDLVFLRDDPIADYAGHGYYAVMQAARAAGVKVMLQGQGGDELFWGYSWLRRAAQRCRHQGTTDPQAVRTAFEAELADFPLARALMRLHYAGEMAERVDGGGLDVSLPLPEAGENVATMLTRLVCETYLLENGIAQGDRLSMAASVEMRLPLLDYRFVEIVIGLRRVAADDTLPPKTWLREALRDRLPAPVLRRPKRGFSPPVDEWHRAIFARHGESLRDGYLVNAEILERATIAPLARGDVTRGASLPLSFKALVLETWCRRMQSLSADRLVSDSAEDVLQPGTRIRDKGPMPSTAIEVNPDLSQREIEGELLLLTPNDDVLYTLNGSGRLVWERIGRGIGLEDVAAELASVYDIPVDTARADVAAFVSELESKGVLLRRG